MILSVIGALAAVWLALAAALLLQSRTLLRSGPRPVSPVTTAAAACGENFCAVSLVALCAAVYAYGLHIIWLAMTVGVGFIVYAVLIAGPLRRAHVFSLADFVEWRLESRKVRRIATICVVAFCLCLLVAQYRFVGDIVERFTDWPAYYAWIALAGLALLTLVSGRPGAGAGFQSLSFWIKCVGFTVPALLLLGVWATSTSSDATELDDPEWTSLAIPDGGELAYYSVAFALTLGVVGFPLFVFRYYGTRDSAAARDAVTVTLALVASVVVLPIVFAILAYAFVPRQPGTVGDSMVMFLVPHWVAPGALGTALAAMLVTVTAVTAVAVTVSLSSAVGSHVSQCLVKGGLRPYHIGATAASVVPVILIACVPALQQVDVGVLVLAGFHVSAATLAPVLLLGIWWQGLTAVGAGVGMAVGLAQLGLAAVDVLWGQPLPGGLGVLVTYPGLTAIPVAVLVMVIVSLVMRRRLPGATCAALSTLHGDADTHQA